ncbi:MAG TPA: amidohydrolase [Bacteroidota bacterium]
MKTLLFLTMCCCLLSVARAQFADVIFKNAVIWTVDPQKPSAEAVAVLGGKILAVGTNKEIDRLAGPKTDIVDVEGKLLLPGFIDDHTHFMGGGFQLQNVDLRYAANEEEFTQRIKERSVKRPGKWITGGDWDHDNWPDGKLPTRDLIDAFTTTTPVFVNRYDGHMALANSYVLNLAKISKNTPDPPGGTIVRDPKTGEPTGILKDAAMDAVYSIMPDATNDEMLEAAKLALGEARRLGLTSIQDVSSDADVAVYRKLKESGELTARMYCRLPIGLTEKYIREGLKAHTGDEWVRVGALKAFADGSLGSSTALFAEKYVSEDTRGLATDIVLDGRLERWALAADKAGIQLSIHAIGDSANGLMLDLFEKIIRENPQWDRRFRIEHAQHIRPQDFQRFAALGVIASAQPYHAIDDGRWAEKRIGHERCKTTYAFRTFLDNHVHLSFGSDWTVAPLNPILGIYAAATRRTTEGANPGGWFPEQKLTVQEAVQCYTINNAYAAFEENEKGSITSGKLADFVILSENIFAIDPVKIEHVTVEKTIVGGKTVFAKNR